MSSSAPSGWLECAIGELGEIVTGSTPPTSNPLNYGGTLPFVSPANLDAARWIEESVSTLSKRGAELARVLPPKAVLVSCIGILGKVGQARGPVATNQQINAIVPGRLVDAHFLYHLAQRLGPAMARVAGLQVLPIINKGLFSQIEVSLPPLLEQRQIAETLDTVDEAIRNTEEVIAKLKQVKQGLLHDLLTRGIDDNGELRDPDLHPERFKDSPLGRIPKAWEVVRTRDLLHTIEQGWSPDCPSHPAAPGEWGVLRTTAVVWEGYQDHENKGLPSHLRPRPEYEVRPNDVLVTRAGPNSRVGVVALASATQGRLMLSDKLYRLVHTNRVSAGFLVLGLASTPTQRHLSTLKTGLAESQTNISQAIVRSLWFALPPLDEQERVERVASGLNSTLAAEARQLSKLHLVKQGLMADLLTGRVRVTALLEETAE